MEYRFRITMSKICRICLSNDILCQACNAKMAKGEISPVEIDIARAVNKLSIDADFIKAVYDGFVYILADKRNSRLLIGRNGRTSKKLETEIKKKIRIIKDAEEKDVIERILGVDIIGINVLYSPKQTYKIRVQKLFRHRINGGQIRAINGLLGKAYEVVFE